MADSLSLSAKAILLLTAPLIVGRGAPGDRTVKPLSLKREYNWLAKRLREIGRAPADLLGTDAGALLDECLGAGDPAVDRLDRRRIEALLGRGMQLSLSVEKWRTRAIWVLSRADDAYPSRLKRRLGAGAPAVLYGCGELRSSTAAASPSSARGRPAKTCSGTRGASANWRPKPVARSSPAPPRASTVQPWAERSLPAAGRSGSWRAISLGPRRSGTTG